MNILIRTDTTGPHGLGHLARCLSLARWLRDSHGVTVRFAMRDGAGACEFTVYQARPGLDEVEFLTSIRPVPDVLVIDNKYQYSINEINIIRQLAPVVMLDSLCPGASAADLVILPVAHASQDKLDAWDGSPRENRGRLLHGWRYVMLSDDITRLGHLSARPDGTHLVIGTGGSDPAGVLVCLLDWLAREPLSYPVTAMVGAAFMHHDRLARLRLPDNIRVVDYDPRRWLTASLGLVTFGVTAYELMYLGVPVLTVGHCEENARAANLIECQYRACASLGQFAWLTRERLLDALSGLQSQPLRRHTLRRVAGRLVTGGGVREVAGEIMKVRRE